MNLKHRLVRAISLLGAAFVFAANGMSARAGHGSRAMAVARINGFDKPGLPNGDVNQTGCRVEKRDIGRASDRPDVGDFARSATHLDQS